MRHKVQQEFLQPEDFSSRMVVAVDQHSAGRNLMLHYADGIIIVAQASGHKVTKTTGLRVFLPSIFFVFSRLVT
jgi:hypothetical protein